MNKQFVKELVTAADGTGICKEGLKWVKNPKSLAELLEHYRRYITWCIKRDYPPQEMWEMYARGYQNDWLACGVPDVEFDEQPTACFLCNATGTASYAGETLHGHVFAKHDAQIEVVATDNAQVSVFAYDNAAVRITAEDTAKVRVFLHGNAQVVDTPENERITINTAQ